MGRIIAVTNVKGGIGKTTTVVNVGAGLALKGARVLLIDVDAQGNLATALGVSLRHTIYEILVDGREPARCIVNARPNLDLIGADDSLLSAQTLIAQRADWSRLLEQSLSSVKREYDFVFIDAPGSLTPLNINAMTASTDVLVPTTVETLSIKGLTLLFKQISRLKVSTRSIRMIIPTMFDSRLRQSAEMLKELQETYGNLIGEPIRLNVRLSEATARGKTIYEYDPRSRGALDYARLVDQLGATWGFKPPPKTPREPAAATNGHPPAANGNAAPAPDAAAPQTPESAAARPLVAGAGTVLQNTCPSCGHPLRRARIAGYLVAFCDNCHYKHQELISRSR